MRVVILLHANLQVSGQLTAKIDDYFCNFITWRVRRDGWTGWTRMLPVGFALRPGTNPSVREYYARLGVKNGSC